MKREVMMEETTDLFLCLQILFEKLVTNEKNAQFLAKYLKKNNVITKGQAKKVLEASPDKALKKLISFVEKEGKLDNLEKALCEEDFPGDQQTKTVISHLIQVKDQNLIFIIKNWENLAPCHAELKHLVVGDRTRDEDWVGAVIFAAFDEILQEKDEKPISDSIRKAISKQERLAASCPDSSAIKIILKRTEPTDSSHYPSETEEITLSDAKISPPPAKKSKIFSLLKRSGEGESNEIETKKQKSDQSFEKDSTTTPDEPLKTCSPSSQETAKNENNNVSTTRDTDTTSPKDQLNLSLINSAHGVGPDTAKTSHAQTQSNNSPPQEAKTSGEKEIAVKGSLEDSKKLPKEDHKPAEEPEVDQQADVDLVTQEDDAKKVKWRPKDKKKKKKKGNKKERDKKKKKVKQEKETVEDGKVNDEPKSEEAPNKANEESTKVADVEKRQSLDSGRDGPVTRSQNKGEEEKNRNQNKGSRQEFQITILPCDVRPISTEDGEKLLEFRAVVPESQHLLENTPLCMIFEENNWQPVEMGFNDRKGFFFLRLLWNAGNHRTFRFKFCHKTNQNRNGIAYERLPGDLQWKVNRQINLREVEVPSRVILNVCLFDSPSSWAERCCLGMAKFLPQLETVPDPSITENDTSVVTDMFCWINCVIYGWKTDISYFGNITPQEHEFEKILVTWLRELLKALSNNPTDSMPVVMMALAISVSFTQEKHKIHLRDLISLLFQMSRIDKLGIDGCKNLYNAAKKEHQICAQNGLTLPSFREALQWLYWHIPDKPVWNWILTLPLYWLMVNGDVKTQVMKLDSRRKLLFAKSSLPPIQHLDWTQVWWNFQRTTATGIRKEIFDILPDVLMMSKLHPWIIGTYQFMLNSREFAALILEREKYEIVQHFPIDSSLLQYLEGFADGPLYNLKPDEHVSFETYFKDQLDDAMRTSSEPRVSDEKKSHDFVTCQTLLTIIVAFLKPAEGQPRGSEDILWCFDAIVLRTVSWTILLDLNENDMKKLHEKLTVLLRIITVGIHKRSKVQKYDIEYWNKLLNIAWDIPEFSAHWKKEIIQEIQNSINNFCSGWNNGGRKNDEAFLDFYVEELGDVSVQADVEKCLNEKAYQCTETLLSVPQQRKGWFQRFSSQLKAFVNMPSDAPRPRIVQVFEKLFIKEYEKFNSKEGGSAQTVALRFLCNWSFAAQFYALFAPWLQSFHPETQMIIKKVSENFGAVVKSLTDKKIIVDHLNVIMTNKDRFLLICGVLSTDKKGDSSVDGPPSDVSGAIDICASYLKVFKQTRAAVENFIHVCNYSDYEVIPHAELKARIKIDIRQRKVTDLVYVGPHGVPKSNNFFGITREQLIDFQQIGYIKDSKKLFQDIFVEAINAALEDEQMFSLTDVLQVWMDVKVQIFQLVEQIDTGMLTLDKTLNRFNVLNGVRKDIECEVDLFYGFCSLYTQPDGDKEALMLVNQDFRKTQIFNAFQLQHANEAVDVLLELKDLFSLKGDFKVMEQRKEMIEGQDNVELKDVPQELEIPEMCSVTAENVEILKQFMMAKDAIHWLQQKMKDRSELKVMCDLAMINAGENTMEVDRVSNLLSAVMGFEPLIFWTDEEREKCGSEELMRRCEKIWENVKATKNLMKKWEGTSHQLKWFEEVVSFYGSVEKSSLTRARNINERGVYKIIRHSKNAPVSVENCIGLTIPPEKSGSGSTQFLSLEELRELQSKLMLIAGEAEQGRQDVNIFVDALASVQNLADVYVQLLSSGCMLFAGWEAVIICQDEGHLSIKIKFMDEAPQILGSGTHKELDKLTKILKSALTKWDEHISSKRMEYYHLNEYSIQQIMYLCHELANLGDLEGIPGQVQGLLTFVRKDISIEDLKELLQETRQNMTRNYHDMDIGNRESKIISAIEDSMEQGDEEPTLQDEHIGSDSQDAMKKKRQLVRTLISHENITMDEAKAAVQANDSDDVTSCIEWILLYGLDEELVMQHSMEYDDEMDFAQQDGELEVMHSVFDPNSENTLKEVIVRLQEEIQMIDGEDFLNCVNTVCAGYLDETIAINLQDHLSIELLGTFLDNLSEEGQIYRDVLPGLHQGRPNLLICSEDEILPTILSLYMHNVDQPLPSRSEVLICDTETSCEELERFFRRAMCRSGNGARLLYTLAFADKLDYATSSKVEDIFDKLSKSGKIDEKYQLVILLCKQQHYLATCFDKYVVDGKWSQMTAKIQSYLKQHLQVAETEASAVSVTRGNYMVKVVTSARSGVGKSLYVQRLNGELKQRTDIESHSVTIRLLENKLDLNYVIEKLNQTGNTTHTDNTVLVHVDLTPAVQHGIEAFAFNLFVLGSIQGGDGKVWKTHRQHLYLVEMTDFGTTGEKRFSSRHILNLLPCVECYAPREVLNATLTPTGERLGMDEVEFHSETFQRPFQYLRRYRNNEDLDEFTYVEAQGNMRECIEILLHYCCIENPSWAQLRHFCSFLNVQLKNCEKSVFCTNPYIRPHLAGLKDFTVKFMIKMAQDFATPSLQISDRSVKDSSMPQENNQQDGQFQAHQIRRKWEETSHPYVFFNEDGQTMTFINVKINQNGFLVAQNGTVGTERIASPALVTALQRQGFNLTKSFDDYPRAKKLQFLCQVLGRKELSDPDPTYELTTDNVLKILAIYMRFRCQIPVIIMGETGCGKTRLVEFMSKLKSKNTASKTSLPRMGQNAADKQEEVKNMITLKIHGGISVKSIHKSVEKAKTTEICNRVSGDDFTVLFYDEANTTEAIYAIKEVMCDKSIDGRFFGDSNLQIIAACNPYKKLSKAAIKKLEDSGLGYRIRTSETAHLFGNIPVRSLVYRVVALPPSMQPFVWDFGQLSDDAEKIYIQQMTRKLAEKLGLSRQATVMINNVLSSCQRYMRRRRDECRYVSLRDVERCMTTYEWFFARKDAIYPAVVERIAKSYGRSQPPDIDVETRTLLQTVGVCYHASLDDREPFRQQLATCLNLLGIDETHIERELVSCQSVFLRNVQIGDNIACNEALRENVFMMVVCADMRIPLFLIGKPGSSKSLAKAIVTNNMQGQASHAPLYRRLKQIHVLSYQCSALTDAEGIERVFSQCSQLQSNQNPDTYTAVVVLDEIGLAEDSPNMPLKVLHPLLERQSTDLNTVVHPDKERVGFVGISNWALDPAKMNRGIFLTRTKPSEKDLKKTGKEIFQPKIALWRNNQDLFEMLTSTYLTMYKEQEVEYFGLRDYYSLMKMICSRCNKSGPNVKFSEVVYAILRNFSGAEYQVAQSFLENAKRVLQIDEHEPIPTIPIQKIIVNNLTETDSRFLLLLANQFSVVSLLESCIEISNQGAQVVFGSSFPGDHSYTEICRNINRIKVCMETGKTVILLNMAKIHESLYDALNQHYVTFGGQNYVDLGLGGHRVKCRIAKEFRLIVIEKKDTVYQQYPIPLINRLEKHHFNSDSLLDVEQSFQSRELKNWASDFVENTFSFAFRHAFIGFHDDTISSVVLTTEGDLENCKSVLLQSCSMDAILRLPGSKLREGEVDNLQKVYFEKQQHDGLADVLKREIMAKNPVSVLEITSFSGILSKKDVERLHSDLKLQKGTIVLLSLEQFHTQQEYSDRLDKFFGRCFRPDYVNAPMVLLVQCAKAQSQASLIACARHRLMNKIREVKHRIVEVGIKVNMTVALLLSTEREGISHSQMDALALQPTHETQIIHVDEMRPADDHIAPASNFFGKTLCEVFEAGKEELESGRRFESLVNIRSLLVDCICESIAKVEDQRNENERYLKRVEIFMNLCSSDDVAGDNFRKILLKKVVQIVSEMENENQGITNWIMEKAKDRESLQEGGTFRKTLWLCLKGHMSRFMAYIISIIDRQDNMDLIAKILAVPWELNMWLGMFDQFETSWQNVKGGAKFMIHGSQKQSSCKLPFSFLVIDYLQIQWDALEIQRTKNFKESFFRLFHDFGMKKIITDALDFAKIDVMKNFISDLIGSLYHTGTEDKKEVEVVESVIFDIAMKNFETARGEKYFMKGDEIAVIFLTFKRLSDKLEKFSEILQDCPEVLRNSARWTEEQKNCKKFTLHILAFKDVLNLLKNMAEKIQDSKPCLEWIDLARTAKKIFDSVSGVLKDSVVLQSLKKDWVPLLLLDLLLMQLLPPAHSDDVMFRNFVKVIAPHAKLFWRGTVSTDARSYNFLRIVLNVLKRCYEDVNLHLLVNWCDTNCRICRKKMQNPTFLQCGHFGCEKCIMQHVRSSERCMTCATQIPEDFTSHSEELDEKQTRILEKLKSNCTSFFLDYLKQFCFKNTTGATGRMEQHVKQILKELIIQSFDQDYRKELDATGLDLNINTKSCIIQILLRHDHDFVLKQLNKSLEETKGNTRNLLITVILKHSEQKILAKSSKLGENMEKLTKFWQEELDSCWHELQNVAEMKKMKFEVLQRIAALRCAFKHCTLMVDEKTRSVGFCEDKNDWIESFILFCVKLLKGDNTPQVVRDFVIKAGCRKFGTQWLQQMAKHTELRVLIPPAMRQAAEGCSIDHWALLGWEYTHTYSKLYELDGHDNRREVEAILDHFAGDPLSHLLALTSWSDKKGRNVKDMVADILRQKYGRNFLAKFFVEKREDLRFLLAHNLPTAQMTDILYQLTVLVAAATTAQNDIMRGFYDVMITPQLTRGLFLPTMPEDVYFATPAKYRSGNVDQMSMYRCPRGHLYSVDKCTRPVVTATCPECRSTIGGTKHKPAEGNEKVFKSVQSQTGYKSTQDGNVTTGAERMSPQGATVTQFLLHSTLLIASLDNGPAVASILQCRNGPQAQQFLIQRLQANLRELSMSLARNADDTILIIHRILQRIINQGPKTYDENWATLDTRKNWEQTFRTEYLLPVFRNLDAEIVNAQAVMRESQEAGIAPLNRLFYEVPDDGEIVTDFLWEERSLWNIIEHPNSAHLIQVLGDKMVENGGEVLQIILQTSDLHFVKFLDNVLKLQQKLTERYQYKIDMNDADQKTFRNYIIEDGGDSDENAIMEYISAWNEVYKSLQNVAPDYLAKYFEPISLDSPLSMVLPSIRGRGQCAKILVEYLIEIQNQFLTKCVEVIKPAQKLIEVEVHHLSSTDFVCINKQKDLLNLINMNTNYTITCDDQGRHHATSYNIEALEKQVREKFVMCKKSIKKNTIPCMKYPQDVGIGSDWQKVAANIAQETLTAKLSQDIDRIVEKSLSSDVCEGVRTLTNAISFLAMVKANPSKLLCQFLEEDLKLSSARTSIIPRSAQISHVLSLYQRITWHKSIIFVQQGLDPYKEALSGIAQELIPEKIVAVARKSFEHFDVRILQQRINEMLITGTGIDNPEWTLTENVFPFLQFLDKSEDDSWYSKLPEELCNKHLRCLFRLTVEKQQQMQN